MFDFWTPRRESAEIFTYIFVEKFSFVSSQVNQISVHVYRQMCPKTVSPFFVIMTAALKGHEYQEYYSKKAVDAISLYLRSSVIRSDCVLYTYIVKFMTKNCKSSACLYMQYIFVDSTAAESFSPTAILLPLHVEWISVFDTFFCSTYILVCTYCIYIYMYITLQVLLL